MLGRREGRKERKKEGRKKGRMDGSKGRQKLSRWEGGREIRRKAREEKEAGC